MNRLNNSKKITEILRYIDSMNGLIDEISFLIKDTKVNVTYKLISDYKKVYKSQGFQILASIIEKAVD